MRYHGTDISFLYIMSRCIDTRYFDYTSSKYLDILITSGEGQSEVGTCMASNLDYNLKAFNHACHV